jgi:hypothetical protein
MRIPTLFLAIACLTTFELYASDVLTLNNKMSFEGKVLRIKKCEVVFRTNGYKYVIPGSEIQSIEFGDTQDHVYLNYLERRNGENCIKGQMDAQMFHGKKGGHFVLGFLFGPFAMIGTAISSPTPVRGRDTMILSQNSDLFTDPEYISCYKKKAKGQLIGMEAAGWGAWILLYILMNSGSSQ